MVLERRDRPGGAADTAEIAPGVRGPVAAHTVGRLRRSVIRDLGLERHGLRLVRPDILAVSIHPDGRSVRLSSDPSRTARDLGEWSTRDAREWVGFDRKVRALASVMVWVDAATPPDLRDPSVADAMTGLRLARAVRGLRNPAHVREAVRVLPTAVADFLEDHLETDAIRGAVAARAVLFTAMGPRSAGSTAVLLSDTAGTGTGAAGQATIATGGPGSVSDALLAAARSFGAEVRCGREVERVTVRGDRATGVVLADGEEVAARAVVSGADPKRTLLDLLDPEVTGPTLGWRAGNIRTPGTVSKVNLALDGFPAFRGADEGTLRGRVLIGATGIGELERSFDASKYGAPSERPLLEITIPTLSDPTLAPEGTHVLSAVVQWTPFSLRDGTWDDGRDALGDRVLGVLEDHAPGITAMVTHRHVLTPLDLERDYGLTGGHPMHAEHGLDQLFAWRPMLGAARYRLPVPGLYLCGSGAHPGGGITGAPGANAAREVVSDLKRRRTGRG